MQVTNFHCSANFHVSQEQHTGRMDCAGFIESYFCLPLMSVKMNRLLVTNYINLIKNIFPNKINIEWNYDEFKKVTRKIE